MSDLTATDIKDRIARAWEAAWDRGEMDQLHALLAEDYRRVGNAGGEGQTREEYLETIRATREAFPDLTTVIDSISIDGSTVAIRWHSVGTHESTMLGVPATHRKVQASGATFAQVDDDRIVREDVTWDPSALHAALGIIDVAQSEPLSTAARHAPQPAESPVSVDTMKAVNRKFITGVTVVTTMDGETPRGLAVNAFSSISLDPPTVLVCVMKSSTTHDVLFRAAHLAINIISVDQLDVVGRFASKDPDKFAGLGWTPAPHGSPFLDRSCARMEVQIRERLQASTHTIFICRVVEADVSDHVPMVYSAGAFFDGGDLTALQ